MFGFTCFSNLSCVDLYQNLRLFSGKLKEKKKPLFVLVYFVQFFYWNRTYFEQERIRCKVRKETTQFFLLKR